MFHDILFLILGLILIVAGGNYLTDGAEAVARRFHVSKLVIGLTVVAFGSSTPDLVISLMSTLEGKSSLALGDIVGANIFDLLFVVGVMAVITPVPIGKDMENKDIFMLVLSSLTLFFCGDDVLFDGSHCNMVSRTDGLMLLAFFAIFMAYTFSMAKPEPVKLKEAPDSARASQRPDPLPVSRQPAPLAADEAHARRLTPALLLRRIRGDIARTGNGAQSIWLSAVMIVGGLAALVIGGNWIVDGASAIALKAGLSEAMVGLTIVAFGSSAPDLATSAIAAWKRQPQIALGNVVGACAFNVFFIIGVCATCRPLDAGTITFIDFTTLVAAAVLLWIFGATRSRGVSRPEGILLIALYLGYTAYVITTGIGH